MKRFVPAVALAAVVASAVPAHAQMTAIWFMTELELEESVAIAKQRGQLFVQALAPTLGHVIEQRRLGQTPTIAPSALPGLADLPAPDGPSLFEGCGEGPVVVTDAHTSFGRDRSKDGLGVDGLPVGRTLLTLERTRCDRMVRATMEFLFIKRTPPAPPPKAYQRATRTRAAKTVDYGFSIYSYQTEMLTPKP